MTNKPTPACLIALPVLILLMVVMSIMMLGPGPPYQAPPPEEDCSVSGGGTGSQKEHVRTVIGVAKSLDVSERGQIIAVMVMLVESNIQVLANDGLYDANVDTSSAWGSQGRSFWLETVKASKQMPKDGVGSDHDSVGLFQQRPAMGWADTSGFNTNDDPEQAVARLMSPVHSAMAFFGTGEGQGLLAQSGWESMPMGEAADAVQRSKFPQRYAERKAEATDWVEQNQDAPKIDLDSGTPVEDEDSEEDSGGSNGFRLPIPEGKYELTDGFGDRAGEHQGADFAADLGTPIHAIADGVVESAGPVDNGFANWVLIEHTIDGQKYRSLYAHVPLNSIKVSEGDKVTAGDTIAEVGDEGRSSGPHLHLEIWQGGYGDGKAVDPVPLVEGNAVGPGGDECNDGVVLSGTVKDVIEAGLEHTGVPYSWGGGDKNGPTYGTGQGAGTKGFDCSGLMLYMLYQGADYTLPRVASDQYQDTKGNRVGGSDLTESELQPGDLLYWGDSAGSIYHTAMYVGEGLMIEAPQTGDVVKVTEVRLGGTFYAATRPDYGGS